MLPLLFARILTTGAIVSVVIIALSLLPSDVEKELTTRSSMQDLMEKNQTGQSLSGDHVDAWGNMIVDDFTRMRSAGPDGYLLTDDDILVIRPTKDQSLP